LGQILGIVLRAREPKTQNVQAVVLVGDQAGKRPIVTVLGRHSQVFVAYCQSHY
jgi:hypothetical protein